MNLRHHRLLSLALGVLVPVSTFAQVTLVVPTPVPTGPRVDGLIYYAVEDRTQQQVVRRGTAGALGVAFDQLILAPNTSFRVWLLEAATLRVGELNFTSPDNGQTLRIPPFVMQTQSSHDSDRDGLPDLGEFIMGTNGLEPDTDGDGVNDGAEVRQGTDPLSGRAVRTGVVGSAQIPGNAIDVCAINDLAIVACRDRGVAVLNIFNGMSPVLIVQVDTPGDAVSVACSASLIAVADGAAGLAIVDMSDPPNTTVRAQVSLGDVRAVASSGSFAYGGLRNGHLVSVEMNSGAELQRFVLPAQVFDLAVAGEYLFALAGNRLHAFHIVAGFLEPAAGDIALSSFAEDQLTGRKRLFVGGGIAYASNGNGYDTVNVRDPAAMQLMGRTALGGPASFKQIVLNGSGLGVAAVGVVPRADQAQDISLYRTANPSNTTDFVTTLITPGIASAIAIYNGLAYAADGTNGLQVVNYLAFDTRRQAPSISLFTSASDGRAEEGQFLRVTAEVGDDVQVRNVEFYLDGQKLITDGNFPFEQAVLMPFRAAGRPSVVLRARASDTGGNITWSDELVLTLAADATPPRVVRVLPPANALVGIVSNILAVFSEPISRPELIAATFRLSHAGADGIFGTPDDSTVVGATFRFDENLNAAELLFANPLPPGTYRASVGPPTADRVGNVMAEFAWSFRLFDRVDRDQDGVPDELEPALGLDPAKTDTNGNGVPDGQEDPDRDSLPTSWEIFFAYDPIKADSDNNAISDDREDPDRDFLLNLAEFRSGTDPRKADTDNDGWSDEVEVAAGSEPLNRAFIPRFFVVARPRVSAAVAGLAISPGSFIARPPVTVIRPAFDASQQILVGKPPLQVRIGP